MNNRLVCGAPRRRCLSHSATAVALSLLLATAFPWTAQAAIDLVQTATGVTDAGLSVSATYSSQPTQGNLLVAIAGNYNGSGSPTLPPGWSTARYGPSHTPGQSIYYKIAGAAEPTVVTFSNYPLGFDTRLGLHIYEYSGINTTDPLDVSNIADGFGMSISPGAVTTTATSSLIIAAFVSNVSTSALNWTDSFVEQNDFTNGGAPASQATYSSAHLITGSVGAYTTTATTDADANWRAEIVAFNGEFTGSDLRLTMNLDNSSPNEDDTIVYTVTLTNGGPDDATGVAVTDLLPAGVTYVSDTPSQGSYVSGTGIWTVGALTSATSATLDITATVNAGTGGTFINNTATITAADQADPVPGNNSATRGFVVPSLDLQVMKAASDYTPNEGDDVVFTITVKNWGPYSATGVAVTDSFPDGLTYVSSVPSRGSYNDTTGVWDVGTIAMDADDPAIDLTFNVNPGTAGSTLVNIAQLTDSDQADINSFNNLGMASITVQSVDLEVVLSVDRPTPIEGDTITYTVTVNNNGPHTGTGIAVTDQLPAGVTYFSDTPSQGSYISGTGVWTVGTLANAGSATLDITATVDPGTTGNVIDDSASIVALDQTDTVAANDSDIVSITVQGLHVVSGTVFEDALVAAGTGEPYDGTGGDTGIDGVRVELFDASDVFQMFTITDLNGVYSFADVAGGSTYTLRVVASTVDAGVGALAEQTFESDGTSNFGSFGTAMGGEDAAVADAATQSTLTGAEHRVQVAVGAANVTGVNFGFSYDLIVNTNHFGQGTLRQFMANANLIGGPNASVFNIPDTDTRYQDGGPGASYWRIQPTSVFPTISTGDVTFDGDTQTANAVALGFNVNDSGPEIELNGDLAGDVHGITLSSPGNTIRNLIINGYIGQFQAAIQLNGASANGNTIAGNYIGTDFAGSAVKANFYGIRLIGSPGNTIGGVTAADRNVISGNAERGISIGSIGSNYNLVQGNYIGTNATGTAALGNLYGIELSSGPRRNRIGGPTSSWKNVISGNNNTGVYFSDADSNTVAGNFIGTNVAGTAALANMRGIWLSGGSSDNVIGGNTPDAGNVISGNSFRGLIIGNAGADRNIVYGNLIGTDATGVNAIGNTGPGVQIQFNAQSNIIGGTNAGEANTIAYNNGIGVSVANVDTDFNTISGNSIHSNAGLGIDIAPDSVGVGSGANDDTFPPTIGAIVPSGPDYLVSGTVDAAATVEFFRVNNLSAPVVTGDATGSGEGYHYVATLSALVEGGVNDLDVDPGEYSFLVPGGSLSQGDWLTATATNTTASTSEFAANTAVDASTYTIAGTVFEDADFAGTASEYDGGTGDAALGSVDVELYAAADSNFVATTTTDVNGQYTFSGLSDGSYFVRARAATIGDADTPPLVGLNPTVPATWSYPLPEMTWGNGVAMYGGQDPTVDDTNTGDDTGPGDTYVGVTVTGADVTEVNMGFAYNLIVNTMDDINADNETSTQGSLRQFIKNANAIAGVQTSYFNIPSSDPNYSDSPLAYTIQPLTALSEIADTTIVDGTTQPDFPGTPIIVLAGPLAGASASGLHISAGGSTVRGFVISQFMLSGIYITAAGGNTIEGNYIGIDITGLLDRGNGAHGIHLDTDTGANTIGGAALLQRNVISGNGVHGIHLQASSTNAILGNYIGTDKNGTPNLGNGGNGVLIDGGDNNAVGGPASGESNHISGNLGSGISVTG